MTVAAIVLAASPASALEDADGLPRVRRIVDSAWSGGAMPIVVVAPDPDGAVAAALAGAEVTLAEPAPMERGPAAQMARGLRVAAESVRGIDAGLIWPARMVWVGPETITSLIEAHGVDRARILRPSFDGDAGWPALVPIEAADALDRAASDRMPDSLIVDLEASLGPIRTIELGDPGTIHDASVARADLPDYSGPLEPAAPHSHEWGAATADEPDDAPLQGPPIAPFDLAEDD